MGSKIFILIGLLFSMDTHAEPPVPQWGSLYIESLEGGSQNIYTKASLLGYEKNFGKFFFSGEYKKLSGENINNDMFGVTAGIQPDWNLVGEPRLSIGTGIGRGKINGEESRSSYITCKGELIIKVTSFWAFSIGTRVTNLQSINNDKGFYQETLFGLRLFFY